MGMAASPTNVWTAMAKAYASTRAAGSLAKSANALGQEGPAFVLMTGKEITAKSAPLRASVNMANTHTDASHVAA